MRIIEGYVLRTICNEHLVVGEGIPQIDLNSIVSLNATAAFLWKQVEGKDFTVEELTKLLVDNYDVNEDRAASDAAAIAAKWIEVGVVSE